MFVILIVNDSNLFDILMYADDTTLTANLNLSQQNGNSQIDTINNHLNKIVIWLQVNKLSLNINKSKYMIFHMPNKKVVTPDIKINETKLECVKNFNFLGIVLDESLTWTPHITKIKGKLYRILGILNRLKHLVPDDIKSLIYNSLAMPHLNYGLILWGQKCKKIFNLQKKMVRVIMRQKYNAHTNPIFKKLKILKVHDMYKLSLYKFYYKFHHEDLPENLLKLRLLFQNDLHDYQTRQRNQLHINPISHTFAEQKIDTCLPKLINCTPENILLKIQTHSFQGYSTYIKHIFLSEYPTICSKPNCYVCKS